MGNVNMEARQIHFRGGNKPNTVADELDSLKSGLTNYERQNFINLEVPNRVNLFDKNSVTNNKGIGDSSELVDSSVSCVSDYIPVISGATYYLYYYSDGGSRRVGFYDKDKTALSPSDSVEGERAFTVPANAKYCRVGLPMAYKETAQINIGNTQAAYTPYIPSVESRIEAVESGLTNYENQNNLNLEVPNRKNVLPNGVKSGSFAGVEWTLNDDGSITFNGTATRQIFNKLYFSKDLDLPVGEYIYSGGSNSITFQLANKAESQSYYTYTDSSGYIEVTQAMVGDMIARLIISNGTVLNNVTIYPMIRPKSIADPTFAPYIPSVESRIEAVESGVANLNDLIVYVSDSESFGNVAVGETKRTRLTLPAKTGYNLASANGHLNSADSAIVSCQITDNTTLDVYVTNIKSFVLENQTLYYRLIYVKTSA